MTALIKDEALAALNGLLPTRQVVTNPVELIPYEVDAGLDRGQPDAVVYPRNAEDVVQVVRWAAAKRTPLVARGAGTGLSGGAVAEHGGVILQFSHMTKISKIDEAGRSVIAQPGAVNQTLDTLAKARGLYYPPDPSSGRTATIGGNIAENSGGPHCFKYGVTTNYVSGLEAVLADGRMVQFGGAALDYPAYDLVGVLTGSEGTLGVITSAQLRLMRFPPAVKTLMAAFDSVEMAGEAVSAVIARGLVPATLEMMDQKMMRIIEDFTHAGLPTEAGAALIIEADGYPESVGPQIDEIETILREQGARQLRVAQTTQERDLIWYGRKSAAGAMARLAPAFYLVDVTVPRSKLAPTLTGVNQICTDAELRVGYVFHAGDGNLHPLILIENPSDEALVARVVEAGRQIVELCVGFDGSITGEHGVGIEKRAFMPLMYSPAEIDVMRDIKQVFDPGELLNPGKIFPPEEPEIRDWRLEIARANLQFPISNLQSPTSPQEAAEQLRALTAAGKSIRFLGGGTKSALLGPADVTLSTDKLRGVITYARDDLYITVGAGTPLDEVQAELARDRMWAPLVSPWPDATVGGIVATNFNAPLRMRYGGVRDLVLATTVALPDGRVIRAGRPVVKNVAGYDLPKLFASAHGTLGLLADVTLKLAPLPRARANLIVPVDSLQAGLALATRLLPICLVSSALLLCDAGAITNASISAAYALIYTAEGLPEDVEAELDQVRDALRTAGGSTTVQTSDISGSDVWSNWFASASASPSVTLRVGVPAGQLAQTVTSVLPGAGASNGASPTSFLADIPNGLLYLRGALDVNAIRHTVHAADGYAVVLTAPPDAAPDLWGYTPGGLDLMRALKERWNPGGLVNPGAFVV
jgi:D-lactate dehydrogenase (cytochrome)